MLKKYSMNLLAISTGFEATLPYNKFANSKLFLFLVQDAVDQLPWFSKIVAAFEKYLSLQNLFILSYLAEF